MDAPEHFDVIMKIIENRLICNEGGEKQSPGILAEDSMGFEKMPVLT